MVLPWYIELFMIAQSCRSTHKVLCAVVVMLLILGLQSRLPISDLCAQQPDPDSLPMFGQPEFERPEPFRKIDEAFIQKSITKHGDRQVASNAAAAQGWVELRAGRSTLALRYFNEGWLLNPKNARVFWGFGAVLSERGNYLEAIDQLETARELFGGGEELIQLLADIGTVRSTYAAILPVDRELERAQQFIAANQSFAESLELNPDYAPSWREWALSLYEQGRFSEAWLKAGRARDLKAEPFPADFLKKLKSKIAESK